MKWFRGKGEPVNEPASEDEDDLPRLWPDNEADEARKLYATLHNTVQRLCTLSNEQTGLTANGISSIIAGYTVIVDERSYMGGDYVGGDVSILAPLEQPDYITDAHIRRIVTRKMEAIADYEEEDDE